MFGSIVLLITCNCITPVICCAQGYRGTFFREKLFICQQIFWEKSVKFWSTWWCFEICAVVLSVYHIRSPWIASRYPSRQQQDPSDASFPLSISLETVDPIYSLAPSFSLRAAGDQFLHGSIDLARGSKIFFMEFLLPLLIRLILVLIWSLVLSFVVCNLFWWLARVYPIA